MFITPNICFPVIDDGEDDNYNKPAIFIAVRGTVYDPSENGQPNCPLPKVTGGWAYNIGNQSMLDSTRSTNRRLIFRVRNRGGNILNVIYAPPTNESRTPVGEKLNPKGNKPVIHQICECCGGNYIHVYDTTKSLLEQLDFYSLNSLWPILVTNHLTKEDIRIIRGCNIHAKVYKVNDLYIVKYMSIINDCSRVVLGLAHYRQIDLLNNPALRTMDSFHKVFLDKGVRAHVTKVKV